MRDDYTELATSDISASSFHINAKYMFINGLRMPDVLAAYYDFSMYINSMTNVIV